MLFRSYDIVTDNSNFQWREEVKDIELLEEGFIEYYKAGGHTLFSNIRKIENEYYAFTMGKQVMATAQDLINVALSFNGYDRSDAALFRNDYASRHGAEFAGYNVPYCDIFVTFCSRQVGLPDADSAYVPGRVNGARSEGMLVDTYSGAVGDFVKGLP